MADPDVEVVSLEYRPVAEPRSRRLRAVVWLSGLGLAGTACGLVAAGIPAAILDVTWASVSFTGGPDSLFLTFMVAATFAAVAGAGLIAAVVCAFFRTTRPLGLGYMAGVAVATLAGIGGLALVELAAALLS